MSSSRLLPRLQILGQPLKPDHQRRVALDLNRLVLNPLLCLHRRKAIRRILEGNRKRRLGGMEGTLFT